MYRTILTYSTFHSLLLEFYEEITIKFLSL